MNRVVVDVVKASEIRPVEGDLGFPVLEPDLSTRKSLSGIDLVRTDGMEFSRKAAQCIRFFGLAYVMIVIGEYGPCLESPSMRLGQIEE